MTSFWYLERVNLTNRNLLELRVISRMKDEKYYCYKLSYTKVIEQKAFGQNTYQII